MHYFSVNVNCVSKNSTQQIIPQLWQLDYTITIEDLFCYKNFNFSQKPLFSTKIHVLHERLNLFQYWRWTFFSYKFCFFMSDFFCLNFFCHSMQNSSISIFSASKRSLSGLAFGERFFQCIRLFFRFDKFYPFYAMCYCVKCAKTDCFLSFGRKKSTEMIVWKFSNSFGLFWDLCCKCASFFLFA